ncbi:hypothetical protein [Tellurirhabdus bombi]|uniref:hypothetical protein n=1 Tax=Tellurirhabdus bombi TaxID=2907205 RepID=UPI001F1C5613|nr:hypothetical protein [Tellurirhabdus bombi]
MEFFTPELLLKVFETSILSGVLLIFLTIVWKYLKQKDEQMTATMLGHNEQTIKLVREQNDAQLTMQRDMIHGQNRSTTAIEKLTELTELQRIEGKQMHKELLTKLRPLPRNGKAKLQDAPFTAKSAEA